MPERRHLAAPMMRATASLRRHNAGRQPTEKLQHAPAPLFANDDDRASSRRRSEPKRHPSPDRARIA